MTHSFSLPRIPALCCHHLSRVSSSPYLVTNKPYLVSRRRNAGEVVTASQRLCFMSENVLSEIDSGGKRYGSVVVIATTTFFFLNENS